MHHPLILKILIYLQWSVCHSFPPWSVLFHHFPFCDCTTATIQSLPTACTLPARETGGTGSESKGGEGSQSHPISSQEMAHAAKGKAPCTAHHYDSGDGSLGSLLSENPAFFGWIAGNSGEREREKSNLNTLLYKDCSLGSVKNLTTSPC